MRDDPGGLLTAAVEISDMFLDKGEIVSTRGRNTPARKYIAEKNGFFEELPMAVLINQNSASASEIVSAALQDHKRAIIVGQRSYGKGSVQNIIDLDGGKSVLKLTVASYYRPSGENIHRFKNAKTTDKWGVSPDPGCEVKLANSEFIRWYFGRLERDKEASAKGHRRPNTSVFEADKPRSEVKNEKPKPSGEAKSEAKKSSEKGAAKTKSRRDANAPFVDKQLDKALEVLRAKLTDPKTKT